MANTEQVQALAARGFWVFPVEPGGKLPAVKDWPNKATRDADKIAQWWANRDFNVGISTSRFGDDKALVVVDVDNKEGKDGNGALIRLELEGYDLPTTLEHATPSGGRHLIYVADAPCKQGVEVLGSGLDIRSRGGFIVGPGSSVAGKPYHQINGHGTLADAPGWLVARLGEDRVLDRGHAVLLDGVDADRARDRALVFLKTAPVAVEGQGGDITTYKVAAKLKDLGCTADEAEMLMVQHWNDRCSPPWGWDELADKVNHAYRYGREPQGIAAPEAVFPKAEAPAGEDEAEHPFHKLNHNFAFVLEHSAVVWETTDKSGLPKNVFLTEDQFKRNFRNKRMSVGEKTKSLAEWWLGWEGRRECDALVFEPGKQSEPRFMNLWKGFAVEPRAGGHPSVDAWKEHLLFNVCEGNETLARWLTGWFAHMIQRPWEKPLVATVFRGRKGTGKNALIDRVGHLLGKGRHYMVASQMRYVVGQFNVHMENKLCLVLDEAYWSGDKSAEGRMKDLITGDQHYIERKGFDPYPVDNLLRLAIIGNEQWIVPASVDERRFAVFNVGDGRMQDRRFFESMRKGMEDGGYGHLLHYLQHFDLGAVDVNAAPSTRGLVDQKHASLEPVQEWWLECLTSGQMIGGSIGELPHKLPTNRVVEAFQNWARGRNIRQRLPGRNTLFDQLQQAAPSLGKPKKVQPDNMGDATYAFVNPGIGQLRQDWERYVGGTVAWSD